MFLLNFLRRTLNLTSCITWVYIWLTILSRITLWISRRILIGNLISSRRISCLRLKGHLRVYHRILRGCCRHRRVRRSNLHRELRVLINWLLIRNLLIYMCNPLHILNLVFFHYIHETSNLSSCRLACYLSSF